MKPSEIMLIITIGASKGKRMEQNTPATTDCNKGISMKEGDFDTSSHFFKENSGNKIGIALLLFSEIIQAKMGHLCR